MITFDGTNDYITMGAASGLNAQNFTLSAWIYKTGTGATASTGTGGVVAYPIVTKGRGEADTPANLNLNYFMGWRSSDNVLVGDFEDSAIGLNHPIAGTTVLALNTWYHVCYVFDNVNSLGKLYVNGVQEGSSTSIAFSPEPNSIQHFGIGTAMTSAGTAAGFWAGHITEVAMWSSVLTDAEIAILGKARLKGLPYQIQKSNLKGYWMLDDFADGVTASGAGAIKDRTGNTTVYNGTPTNSPVGKAEFLLSYN